MRTISKLATCVDLKLVGSMVPTFLRHQRDDVRGTHHA